MDLSDLITPYGIIPSLKANSKKHLLQALAARASEVCGLEQRAIFETLLQRERLGSTGYGNGIAIPHGSLAGLNGIIGLFARLDEPVDFDAIDEKPVDLVFLLLAPERAGADHLKALARISRLFRQPNVAKKLRGSKDQSAIYAVLTDPVSSHAA
jgi:PTS system nitrogen regulatory IIA component